MPRPEPDTTALPSIDDHSSYEGFTAASLRRRRTAKWNYYPPDVLALWVAEMDFPTAPVVLSAIAEAVDRQEFGYARADLATGLPRATTQWLSARYGWQIDEDRVHLLPDVLKGVELAIELYSPAGSPVALPTPAYMPFFEVPKVVNRPTIEIPMQDHSGRYSFDLERIDKAFVDGAGSLILCNPYNPLGRSFSVDELRDLSEVVTSNNARVVSDEIHAPLTYDGTHVPYATVSGEAAAHSITMVSASKAWNLPGLKCAQAIITNESDETLWRGLSGLKTHGASTIGIEASIAAYSSGGPWLDATLSYLDGNRRLLSELLSDLLPGARYTIPEATYLAWIDFSALGLGKEPAEHFLEQSRVALSGGIAFGANGSGCARLNFATSAAILRQAVEAMATALPGRA
jgi:cysteine-S-conjugate beta-lyase